jgi:hypothetical protein
MLKTLTSLYMSCCIYLIVCESTLGRGEGYHEWPKRMGILFNKKE